MHLAEVHSVQQGAPRTRVHLFLVVVLSALARRSPDVYVAYRNNIIRRHRSMNLPDFAAMSVK